ncbi:MAG TPA: VCBS repeat-containing protein, partial [Longimicrobiales bacterium]|nr:VCBS repeat-containing protein [Longimicrobiales bacterium]
LFFANYGPNGLFRNPGGPGSWEDVAPALGLAEDGRYDTCIWADVDDDGRPDLYVNGTVTGGVSYRDRLLRRGDGAFVDITPPSVLELAADHGATWVDYDLDGDQDLALTGAGEDGMHLLMRNLLRPEISARGFHVRVVDGEGHATRPGAEVRVYAAGSRRLLATRLVDTGSGYDAQSDVPLHMAVRGGQAVDVEVALPVGGQRRTDRLEGLDPAAFRGRVLEIRVDGEGRIVR